MDERDHLPKGVTLLPPKKLSERLFSGPKHHGSCSCLYSVWLVFQALNKMEAQAVSQCVVMSTEKSVATSSDMDEDTAEEGEEREEEDKKEGEEKREEGDKREDRTEEEVMKGEAQNPFPVMHLDTPASQDNHCEGEAEPEGDGAEPQEVREDCGWRSPEELLQETVDRLKTEMETDGRRHTGQFSRSNSRNDSCSVAFGTLMDRWDDWPTHLAISKTLLSSNRKW